MEPVGVVGHHALTGHRSQQHIVSAHGHRTCDRATEHRDEVVRDLDDRPGEEIGASTSSGDAHVFEAGVASDREHRLLEDGRRRLVRLERDRGATGSEPAEDHTGGYRSGPPVLPLAELHDVTRTGLREQRCEIDGRRSGGREQFGGALGLLEGDAIHGDADAVVVEVAGRRSARHGQAVGVLVPGQGVTRVVSDQVDGGHADLGGRQRVERTRSVDVDREESVAGSQVAHPVVSPRRPR